jgi:hypothetical protein
VHYAHPFDRENTIEPPSKGLVALLTVACVALGFLMGMEWQENIIRRELDKIKRRT